VYFLNQHSEPPLPFREAVRCLRAYSITEKPETVDVNVKCNMKRPKGAGSIAQFRGTLIYPHTFRVGKETKILVFCEDDETKLLAREAGANEIGGMELLDLIREKGLPPCDLCISTPQMAPHLMEFQKTLKAKMPTEKKGTVVQDVIGAIKLFKNSFQYKSEQGIVNMAIGRLYFNDDELEDNFNHLIQTITKHRDVLPQSNSYFNVLHL
jgi:large subunit ribosomal protein L1